MNWLGALAFAVLAVVSTQGKLQKDECEVCIKFLNKFSKTVTDDERKSQDKLTTKLKKACNKAGGKENRFCYYVGGTTDAATYILNEITKPMGFFKPVESICEALKKKDSQICTLAYDKDIDWKTVNVKKLRVKQLKKILADWGVPCDGCLEKSDFVKKIEAVKHQHVEL